LYSDSEVGGVVAAASLFISILLPRSNWFLASMANMASISRSAGFQQSDIPCSNEPSFFICDTVASMSEAMVIALSSLHSF
jgi:hypothetical protein